MKTFILTCTLILCLFVVALMISVQDPAALTYTRVSVEAVDAAAHSLTFHTADGEVWTLAAFSADRGC